MAIDGERLRNWLNGSLPEWNEMESALSLYEGEKKDQGASFRLEEAVFHRLIEKVSRCAEKVRAGWGEPAALDLLLLEMLRRIGLLGAEKYFDVRCRLAIVKTKVNRRPNGGAALNELFYFAERPYLIKEIGLLLDLFLCAARAHLDAGALPAFRKGVKAGLRSFSGRHPSQWMALASDPMVAALSRGEALTEGVSFSDRICLWSLASLRRFDRNRLIRRSKLLKPAEKVLKGVIWGKERLARRSASWPELEPADSESAAVPPLRSRRGASGRTLVTRAMGGIGDFLMMTPGLHALREQNQGEPVDFAIPHPFFPLFEGNPDVALLDIANDPIDLGAYRKWINLTDCPAARVESRSVPGVRESRIDIFSRAMGIGEARFKTMSRLPRYFLSPADRQFQSDFWKAHRLNGEAVVGLQLFAQESYRDYPFMEALAEKLAADYRVLLFHPEGVEGFHHPKMLKVFGRGIRQAFALAAACDLLAAPDSSFVHFAAAAGRPCIALYGPIDGEVRSRYYPTVRYLDGKPELPCLPCWRNESIPCALSGGRLSACMGMIPVERVLGAVERELSSMPKRVEGAPPGRFQVQRGRVLEAMEGNSNR